MFPEYNNTFPGHDKRHQVHGNGLPGHVKGPPIYVDIISGHGYNICPRAKSDKVFIKLNNY
jgi:hypothetical protein